ncbi:MAG: glycosyltransferase family 9 protein [Bacteroidota bacterium]
MIHRHTKFVQSNLFHISLRLENINRILVIKLRAIGDVLLSTPVVQNLRKYFPAAQIDFLTEKFAADVVLGNPWISNVISFDRKNDSSVGIIQQVRKRKYDLIIDLFSNPRSAVITGLSGAEMRVGFPFRWRKYAYNIAIPPRTGNIHNIEFNLDALRRLDIPVEHFHPYFPLEGHAQNFAGDWFQKQNLEGKQVVGLNPSGGWYTKRWGLEHYALLGDNIGQQYAASIILLWGPGEEEDARFIQQRMKLPSCIIPKTTLAQLGAIIHRCAFVVSNDSGPMHIAASLNIPTLGIFGPTNPRQQGPYGNGHRWVRNEELECLECSLTSCPIGNICMTKLDVERVMEAFKSLEAQWARKNRSEVNHPKEL